MNPGCNNSAVESAITDCKIGRKDLLAIAAAGGTAKADIV
jgi:hypothetical protein